MRLEQLEAEYGPALEVEWRSFLLRPAPDPERTLAQFVAYTQSWLRPAAEEPAAGLHPWTSAEGPPSSSVPPHLIAKAAQRADPVAARRLHGLLLGAYFRQHRDITAEAVLRALWQEAGLAPAAFDQRDDRASRELVIAEHNEAIVHGASGVPAVRMALGYGGLLGAHPLDVYRRFIERAAKQPAQPPAV